MELPAEHGLHRVRRSAVPYTSEEADRPLRLGLVLVRKLKVLT